MIILKHKSRSQGYDNCLPYLFAEDMPCKFQIETSPCFGKTLSISAVPDRTCPGDCIYCPHSDHPHCTIDRQTFFSVEHSIKGLKDAIISNPDIDYIKLGGCGEAALNSDLGSLIGALRKITDKRILVDSCGSLCWRASVNTDFLKCDAVSVHIDSPDRTVYHIINKFHQQIPFDRYVNGIKSFRNIFNKDLFVKVCLIDGINTTESVFYKLVSLVKSFNPASVFVTTSHAIIDDKFIPPLQFDQLAELCDDFGEEATCPCNIETKVS